MWSTYMKTFDEYDKRTTDAWKEDATGILVFVSHNLRIPLLVAMTSGGRLVFSPQLLVLLLSKATNSCPPIPEVRQ
jgi:hypothetical protein